MQTLHLYYPLESESWLGQGRNALVQLLWINKQMVSLEIMLFLPVFPMLRRRWEVWACLKVVSFLDWLVCFQLGSLHYRRWRMLHNSFKKPLCCFLQSKKSNCHSKSNFLYEFIIARHLTEFRTRLRDNINDWYRESVANILSSLIVSTDSFPY